MWRLATLGFALALSACTRVVVQPEALPISSVSHCAASDGVTLRYNTLYVAPGKRPAGSSVHLVSQLKNKQDYQFVYQEIASSSKNTRAAIHPCLIIVMPKIWHQAWVVNQQTGEEWSIKPSDDEAKNEEKTP